MTLRYLDYSLCSYPLITSLDLRLRVSFAYCGTGTYIFLNFSKSFISAYFVCYLFESSFNHGIWLGHCVPNSCRSLGSKKFLTNRVISDTSEKNFIQVWKKWVVYEDGKVFPWIFVFQKIKMCFSKNTRDFSIRELIKIHNNDDFYLKILSFDQYCRKKFASRRAPFRETP